MHRLHRILLALITLSICLPTSGETLPATSYGRLPIIMEAAVSPDGSKIALLNVRENGERLIRVLNLTDNSLIAGVVGTDPRNNNRNALIRNVSWANDRYVTYQVSATMHISQVAPANVTARGTTYLDMWRTAIFDPQKQRTYLISREERHDWGLVFRDLFAPLPGNANQGLMAIRENPYQNAKHNLYRINLNNGKSRFRLGGEANTRGFLLNQDGVAKFRYDADDQSNVWQLLSLNGKDATLLTEGVSNTGRIGVVGLSAQGDPLILDRLDDEIERDVLYRVDQTNGDVDIYFERADFDLHSALRDPWNQTVVGVQYVEDVTQQHFFDPALKAIYDRLKQQMPDGVARLHNWSRDRQKTTVYIELPGDAGGWYLYDSATNGLQRFGLRYPDIQGVHLGQRQAIQAQSRDGAQIPGYLTLPGNSVALPPVVVLPHGGPASRDRLEFDWWASFLASRGYAVVQPNFRGSRGYGIRWQKAGYRQWGRLMQTDIEDTLISLRKAGLVHPSEACIVGASYGGYAALVGGTMTPELYRCVVSVAGVSDLPEMLAMTRKRSGRHGAATDWWTMLIGDLQSERERLEAVSPAYQADNAAAPFLLIHGMLDTVVPIKQSRVMKKALERAGKEVRYVEFSGEDHWLSDAETRIRMLEEIEKFLSEHLPANPLDCAFGSRAKHGGTIRRDPLEGSAMAEPATTLARAYTLRHLTPSIGTEVLDIDLRSEIDDATIRELAALLVERKVIFFREQDITMAQHVAFARRFGELEVHPFTQNNKAHPEVIHLDNDEARPPYINVWHSDVTWRAEPSLGSILRARVIPDVGGDTLFANMEAAYDGLDEATKAQIEHLEAMHDNEGFLFQMKNRGASEEEVQAMREKFPPSVHPVVRTHPVSGNKSLYVNKTFTRRIVDMDTAESEALLEKLCLQAWVPDYQCRFRWRPNSFAFWDNRAAQHYAAADYWPEKRQMERVTIVGDKPY